MNSYFSASWMPQSKLTGPSPLPMATMVSTPASRARVITSSRSESKRWPSRWAWESMNTVVSNPLVADGRWLMAKRRDRRPRLSSRAKLGDAFITDELRATRHQPSAPLLQSRPHRHVLQDPSQHRLAAFERSGDDHAVRFEAAQL